MKIPKYWAKSAQTVTNPDDRAFALAIWQWSDSSFQEAKQQADTRLADIARKVLAGEELNRYSYGERPLREEINKVVQGDAGQELGVITRNRYGALVLNAARALFIDIDFPTTNAGATLANSIKQLFGAKKTPTVTPEQTVVENIRVWCDQRRDLGMVVYRTAGGARCLVTTDVFEPGQPAANEILNGLKSDPLYIKLCQSQGCFRARLTPKPWRCDMDTPPTEFPWQDNAAETKYRQWEQQYDRTISNYTTCRKLQQFGPQTVHPDVARIMQIHDELACTDPNLSLA